MGRKKIEIKKIADEKTLLVTFAKRKKGLYNKAFELGELCDCEIAVIIFTNKNCMHTYSSHDLENTVNKYRSRQDRNGHTSKNDMIRFRERKMINSNNTNDNAGSSDYSPTNDIHLSYYDQVNLNSSRAATTNSSDLFDDQGFPNNVISESFHNGGDNFSTHTDDFSNINDPQEQSYEQPSSSIAYQVDNKPNVCPPSASMVPYDATAPNMTNVFDYNQGLLDGRWVPTTNNGSTSTKPPLETPDTQQVRSSPLRE
ncbi:hypothetical protein ACTXT7_002210 [Hymenolepis weldensis]